MFSKVALLITAAFAISAIATPAPSPQCNSGPVQCCGSLQAPTSAAAAKQLAAVGLIAENLTGQVGIDCNAITVIGAGTGANCASAPVCCEKNFQNQLLGINCTPATVGA